LNDTPPEVNQIVSDRLMALPGEERFCMGSRMFDAVRRMVLASFPDGLMENAVFWSGFTVRLFL
jgi:hypothetical protein